MNCEECGEAFRVDGVPPDCLEGDCQTGFDQLANEDFRLLEIRWMLQNLSELGLGQAISSAMDVTRDDLCQLALIESACRDMARERSETDGEGCQP